MRRQIIGSMAASAVVLALGGVLGCNRGGPDPGAPPSNNVSETKHEGDHDSAAGDAETKTKKNREEHLEATWEGKLHYMPGAPPTNCAVAGRVRLFAADENTPKAADGILTIMLLDSTSRSGDSEPLLIEEWRIDADSLQSFRNQNAAHPEYTFMLPWSTYKNEIEKMRLDVKYEPKSGRTLVKEGEVLTIDPSEMKEHNSN
jgi:hypothetical protein